MKCLEGSWYLKVASSQEFQTVSLTSGHLLGEQGHHLGEVDGPGGLAYQVVGLRVWDWSSDAHKGGLQVVGSDDSILVHVNDSKSFLELLNLFLTEQGEDVGTRLFGLLWSFSRLKQEYLCKGWLFEIRSEHFLKLYYFSKQTLHPLPSQSDIYLCKLVGRYSVWS